MYVSMHDDDIYIIYIYIIIIIMHRYIQTNKNRQRNKIATTPTETLLPRIKDDFTIPLRSFSASNHSAFSGDTYLDTNKSITMACSDDDMSRQSRSRSSRGRSPVRRGRKNGQKSSSEMCLGCRSQCGKLKSYKGISLGPPCMAAVRSRNRSLSDEDIRGLDASLPFQPGQWMLDNPGLFDGGQSCKERRSAIKKIKERCQQKVTESKTTEKKLKDKVSYNKRHYKSHVMFWDRCGSSTASSEFENLREEQQGAYDSDNEEKVVDDDDDDDDDEDDVAVADDDDDDDDDDDVERRR